MKNKRKTRDPVCGMEADNNDLSLDFQGSRYLFCSQQCLDRFTENPHLYIGHPGKPSVKQHGKIIIKSRVLRLDSLVTDDAKLKIEASLKEMMGIKTVNIDKCTVRITYDLLEVTRQQIETTIKGIGIALSSSWIGKLKHLFIDYFEEAELDSLEDLNSKRKSCHD